MADKFKQVPGGGKFEAARLEMVRVFQRYGDDLTPLEQLAVAAYFVGQLVAMQDALTVTPAMAMELVARNLEQGNADAVLATTNGALKHGA